MKKLSTYLTLFIGLFIIIAGCTEKDEIASPMQLAIDEPVSDTTPIYCIGDLKSGGSVTIPPIVLPKYLPPRIAGDREFAGHGPKYYVYVCITFTVPTESYPYYRIYAKTYMDAIEWKDGHVEGDGTHLRGEAMRLLMVTDKGFWIKSSFLQGTYVYSVDTDGHSDTFIGFGPSLLPEYFVITGDTKGDDAGKTGVKIKLNEIQVNFF